MIIIQQFKQTQTSSKLSMVVVQQVQNLVLEYSLMSLNEFLQHFLQHNMLGQPNTCMTIPCYVGQK